MVLLLLCPLSMGILLQETSVSPGVVHGDKKSVGIRFLEDFRGVVVEVDLAAFRIAADEKMVPFLSAPRFFVHSDFSLRMSCACCNGNW